MDEEEPNRKVEKVEEGSQKRRCGTKTYATFSTL
jgi:hypothetical protein